VYKKNKYLEFDIKDALLNKLNPFASDLLERMIEQNPEERVTASEALNSCFFVS
jgi:serine/threonine protein kinase